MHGINGHRTDSQRSILNDVDGMYEQERHLEGKVQILGISVEPLEGKKLIERVTRDCHADGRMFRSMVTR